MIKVMFYIFFSLVCITTAYIIYEYIHYNKFKKLVDEFKEFNVKKCEFVKEGYDEIKSVFKKDKDKEEND